LNYNGEEAKKCDRRMGFFRKKKEKRDTNSEKGLESMTRNVTRQTNNEQEKEQATRGESGKRKKAKSKNETRKLCGKKEEGKREGGLWCGEVQGPRPTPGVWPLLKAPEERQGKDCEAFRVFDKLETSD